MNPKRRLLQAEHCQQKGGAPAEACIETYFIHWLFLSFPAVYPRNEMRTPAATAEPITPEMLEDMQ